MIGSSPNNTDLLRQLDDIKGLHPVSIWPLAGGWLILLIFCGVLLAAGIAFYLRRRAWRQSWKSDALRNLLNLEAKLDSTNAQAIAASLSTTLRRIAIRKFSRGACAGLQGDSWLQWLQAHDPHHFDWLQMGRLLIEAPFMPPHAPVSADKVRELIHAAGKWVK